MDLTSVSSTELLSAVRALVGDECEITAKLVAYLGEVEERRLHLEAGFPSMFAFCTRELKMSENEAFRRIVAARIGRQFPVIHGLLASGAVHLSALELLREHLTEENHVELLEAVAWSSKSEILTLLARRFPKPDVPTSIRKLPQATKSEAPTLATFELEASPSSCVPKLLRGRIEPLSEARYRIEFTASAGLREKLELCRDLMSHANPSRDLGVVVERAMDLLLAELEKKRLGRAKRPRSAGRPSSGARVARVGKQGRIGTSVRRQVFERDGLQCSYVSPNGRRCDARAFLELDHIEPRARGGADDAANLRVRCRAHNQLAAEQVFGREHVDQCRNFVRTKCPRRPNEHRDADAPAAAAPTSSGATKPWNATERLRGATKPWSATERLRSALKGMGFGTREVQAAVSRVAADHGDLERLAPAQALREAILAATPDLGRSNAA